MIGARLLMKGVSSIGVRYMSSISRIYPASVASPIARLVTLPKPAYIQPVSILDQLSTDVIENGTEKDNTMYMDSVLRKRRLKMKKHKLRKRRKEQRSLMKRLGKI